ncbi:uncharacterized protein LOC113488089 [Athene cunicularia]|uniref:uncharacterized protein LOC113488089 n=1 Tax=Athene cunicularia TaxID=194338 RepID=UPI000EF69943|nr:uncharacterized protein LOC113488089 [Athene cunicularia]
MGLPVAPSVRPGAPLCRAELPQQRLMVSAGAVVTFAGFHSSFLSDIRGAGAGQRPGRPSMTKSLHLPHLGHDSVAPCLDPPYLSPRGGFGGLGRTRRLLRADRWGLRRPHRRRCQARPRPQALPSPPESRARRSSRTLQDCQRMINDQQLRNCPHCQFGCCLTRCLMSSDTAQATPRGQLGSILEPAGGGHARVSPQTALCSHRSLASRLGVQHRGPHQTTARNP